MAVRLACDGCDCTVTEDVAVRAGRLEPCFYCQTCAKPWQAFERAEAKERVRLTKAFEAWRSAALAKLRKRLTKLPDE